MILLALAAVAAFTLVLGVFIGVWLSPPRLEWERFHDAYEELREPRR